jgi:hypothetical protein
VELEVRQQVELEVRQQVELEVRQQVELEVRHNQAVELQVAELQGQLKAARERQAVLQDRVVKLESDARRSSRGSPAGAISLDCP